MTCGDVDNTVCIWNISNLLTKKDDSLTEIPAPEITQKVKNDIYSCSYLKDHQSFVTCGNSHLKSWCIEKLLQSNRRSARLSDVHESSTSSRDGGLVLRAAVLGTFRNSNFIDISCFGDKCYTITDNGSIYSFVMATTNNRGRLVIEKAISMKTTTKARGLSINENFISVAFDDGIIRILDRKTFEYIGTLPKPKALGNEVQFHSNQINNETQIYPNTIACNLLSTNNLFSVYSDGSFICWNLSSYPEKIIKVFSEFAHKHCVWDMKLLEFPSSFSEELNLPANTLVTCSADNTIRFWDSQSLSDPVFLPQSSLSGIIHTDENFQCLKNTAPTSTSGIRCLSISDDLKHIASGDRQGNIRIHETSNLNLIDFKEAHEHEVLSLSYAPGNDNKLLASASRDRLIHLFEENETNPTYSHIQTLDDHSSSITSVHFTSFSSKKEETKTNFISCGADKSIIFRNVEKQQKTLKFDRFANVILNGTVFDMNFDKETNSIIATGKDKKLTRFDIETGKQIGDPICAVRDSDDIINLFLHDSGEFILASSTDKRLRMYSCSTDSSSSKSSTFRNSNKENVAASSRRISTSSSALHSNSKCLLVANGPSLITSSCFSPCSSRIYGASADGMIFVWRVSPTLVQKLSRNPLQSPSFLSPRLQGLKMRTSTTSSTPKKLLKKIDDEEIDQSTMDQQQNATEQLEIQIPEEQEQDAEAEEIIKPSSWQLNKEEIESSLVSELGLASNPSQNTKAKSNLGFLSIFSNDDSNDAKMQALRRLTIEPSSQDEPTIADSAALASALSDFSKEENFFDFDNFSEIPESNSSRLSISRVFRQNSSPRGNSNSSPSKKKFLTPDHSPIQVTTPLQANAAPIPTKISLVTPKQQKMKLRNKSKKEEKPQIINDKSIPKTQENTDESTTKQLENKKEDQSIVSNENIDSNSNELQTTNPISPKVVVNSNNLKEKNSYSELSTLLGSHDKEIEETKKLLASSEEVDDENMENDNENQTDMDQINDEDEVDDSHSYDLQMRHQVAMNLLQNAFENAIQLYEDANFEYSCIQKEETPSPYSPIYEQILDDYETVFHSLANKLSETPNPPPPAASSQLNQYSSMLFHLANLIKDKQIVP